MDNTFIDPQPTDYDYSVRYRANRLPYSDLQQISDSEKTSSYILQPPQPDVRPRMFITNFEEETTTRRSSHDRHRSSWFLTFFLLFLLLLIILYAFSLFWGKGLRNCLRCLKDAGMNLRQRQRHKRRDYLRPRYEKLETETDLTEEISEKEDTMVFSSAPYKPAKSAVSCPTTVPTVCPTPASTVCPTTCPSTLPNVCSTETESSSEASEKPCKRLVKRRCQSSKKPIVEIHSTGRESIRLEITTDTECDGYETIVSVDEEDCDYDNQDNDSGPTCNLTELDFDEEDADYNCRLATQKPRQYGRQHYANKSFVSFPPDGSSEVNFKKDDETSSDENSVLKLTPLEKKCIYQRYQGPNRSTPVPKVDE